MKFSVSVFLTALLAPAHLAKAFSSPSKSSFVASGTTSGATVTSNRALFDPLGLYPRNAPERINNRLQPLESTLESNDMQRPIQDPMGLYKDKSQVDGDRPMSASLPFLQRPALLDGQTIPGDRGLDPFNFASTPEALQWQRVAEIKHARLAMLAAVGWPVSELLDKTLAENFHLQPLLDLHDRVPSVLNGGLDSTPGVYWAAALGFAFAIETFGLMKDTSATKANAVPTPGDLGFDPLGLAGKTLKDRKFQAEAELFNGRMAMLGITGFALQEWVLQNSVVNQTPIFFKPINLVLEQLQDAAGHAI